MATIKIDSNGSDGTIRFLTEPPLEGSIRYFHTDNIIQVLGQQSGIIGTQVLAADIVITRPGHETEERVNVLLAITKVELNSDGDPVPTDVLDKEENIIAVSCRPFLAPIPEFNVRKIEETENTANTRASK